MQPLRIGIIGYGYWGPHLMRNFWMLDQCRVLLLCDSRMHRRELALRQYPTLKVTDTAERVCLSNDIDAVIIATPTTTHFSLAAMALKSGKHVLVEKPLAGSVAEAEELIGLAERHRRVLMVDHTFIYTGAVQKIKQLIEDGEIGSLQYFDSTRINLGIIQSDINVLWDLAPHDLSILQYCVQETPVSVQATGASHTGNNNENIAYLTLHFHSGTIAHIHCSWSSPVKIRQILIGGDKRMILYNDIEPTEKIKVYDSGYRARTDDENRRMLWDYRTGDVFIPKLDTSEALAAVARDFLHAINTGDQPIADAASGLKVIEVLEAAQESMRNGGGIVSLVQERSLTVHG